MKDTQIQQLADFIENTWPKQYLRKDRDSLIKTLMLHFANEESKAVYNAYKELAKTHNSAPSVKEVFDAISDSEVEQYANAAQYFEEDGFAYVYDRIEKDYVCIWKPWWGQAAHYDFEFRGHKIRIDREPKSKMAQLRKYGLVAY